MRRLRKAVASLITVTLLLTGQGFSFYEAAAAVISVRTGSVHAVVPTILPVHVNTTGLSQTGSALSLNTALTPLSLSAPSVSIAPGEVLPAGAQEIVVQSQLIAPSVIPAAAVPAASIQTPLLPLSQAANVSAQADEFSQGLTAAKEQGQSPSPVLKAFFDGQKGSRDESASEVSGSQSRWSLSRLLPSRWLSAKKAAPAAPKPVSSFDPKTTVVFLVREGQPTLSVPLSELTEMLRLHPEAAQAMNAKGRVVMVTDKDNPQGGLSKADIPQLTAVLAGSGLTAKLQEDRVSVDWKKHDPAPVAESGAEARKPVIRSGWFGRPLRELAFLGRTAKASYSTPLWSEVIGGLVTKGFPLFVSVATYWKVIGPAHPYLLGIAIAASLFLEIFHGIFLNTWNTFQDNIKKQRGLSYQVFFTLVYMQSWGALFRGLSWGANNKAGLISPPWSLAYWKDILIMSVLGTFFGTLGINGLNGLYAKGRINRWQRSAIQQIRDLLFLLAGPLFASGSMTLFWGVFIFQQLLDIGVFLAGWKAKARPMLYVADASVAQSPEFKAKYPIAGLPQGNPLKEAWDGIKNNPIVRVAMLPYKLLVKLYKKIRGGGDR